MTTESKLSILLVIFLVGCAKSAAPDKAAESTDTDVLLPVVTDERTDLVFTWDADGGAAVGSSVADVPEEARKEVRVQDPSIPPEKAAPDTVFLADLTAPKVNGKYPVKAVPRKAFESERRAEEERVEKARAAASAANAPPQTANMPPLAMPSSGVPVIMYSTKHCPVCVKARRWLLEQKIPYIEKDMDTDQAAAAALQQKAASQGVPVRGVPVFDVMGRIIPGFDPGQILALIQRATAPVQTI